MWSFPFPYLCVHAIWMFVHISSWYRQVSLGLSTSVHGVRELMEESSCAVALMRRLCEGTGLGLVYKGISTHSPQRQQGGMGGDTLSSRVGCSPVVFHTLLWIFKFVASCLRMVVACDSSLWPKLRKEGRDWYSVVFVLVIHKNPRSLLYCQDRDRIFSLRIFAPNN